MVGVVGVVGHAKFDFMVWSHPGPDELVCWFGQSIRGLRFWCFAWFLWLVVWLVWVVGVVGWLVGWLGGWVVRVVEHAKFDFMVWSHPGPEELVCRFKQSIRGSRF